MVKNNQIISDDERKAIKELSELIDELNVTEIEIQNEKVGKVRVSKNKITPNHSNNTPTIKTSAPKDKEENSEKESLFMEYSTRKWSGGHRRYRVFSLIFLSISGVRTISRPYFSSFFA